MTRTRIGHAVVASWIVAASLAWGADTPMGRYLVEPKWLAENPKDPKLRIVDMQTDSKAYDEEGHIPGGVYLSISSIRTPVGKLGFRLPTQAEAEKILGSLGIGRDTMVVIYDDQGGLHAARLFFTLDVFGHSKMAILNGGIQAWKKAGLPVSYQATRPSPRTYRGKMDPNKVATAEWILKHLNDPGVALVDARSAKEFRGEDVRAKRGGHIPGAKNIEWVDNLRPDKTFKPLAELQELYERHGITKDKTSSRTARRTTGRRTPISCCGSSATRKCAGTTARGRNGAIERISRWRGEALPTVRS